MKSTTLDFQNPYIISLQSKKDIHFKRKLWHLFMGCSCASLYFFLSKDQALITLAISMAFFIPFDILRLRHENLNNLIIKLFGLVIRKEEYTRVSGLTYFVTAMFLVVLLFPKEIAMLGIYILSVGDPISSYFGLRYGRTKIFEGKTLEGSLACFFASFAITFIYLNITNFMPTHYIFGISMIGGFAGSLAEMLPFNIDDNFSMPIFSSWVIWIVVSLLKF